jgi:hypothetical protein
MVKDLSFFGSRGEKFSTALLTGSRQEMGPNVGLGTSAERRLTAELILIADRRLTAPKHVIR